MSTGAEQKKKLLLLGGSSQQVVAIETAKGLGLETVLCDYLPDNPGQYHADRFYLVSTTDQEAVLEVARKERIDGVIAYASDPAAPTAAYVAEQLGLPTNPAKSVDMLCNKDRFRKFLSENGFTVPEAAGCTSLEEARAAQKKMSYPLIVKPVDSSGSKGVTVVRGPEELEQAVQFALGFSRADRIVIEEFIEKSHPYLIGGDIFVSEGKVIQWGLMNCHRDPAVNRLVPVGKSYPVHLSRDDEAKARQALQELIDKTGIRFGAMNVELVLDVRGQVYLIDIGPRSGGNMIPDLLGMIFGCDVVEWSVRAAMGETIRPEQTREHRFFATHNLHSAEDGILEEIRFDDTIESYIVRKEIYKNRGDAVERFTKASDALGIVFLKFDDEETMLGMLEEINDHIEVKLL